MKNFSSQLQFLDGVAYVAAQPIAEPQPMEARTLNFDRVRKIDATLDHDRKQRENRAELVAMEMIKQDMLKAVKNETVRMPKAATTTTATTTQVATCQTQKIFETEINVYLSLLSENKPEKTFCDRAMQVGSCFVSSANAAIAMGGNSKTWRGIAQAGNSLTSLASNLAGLKGAETLLDFGLGYWSIASSALSLVFSLFNDDDDDANDAEAEWRQAVFSMLQEIHASIQQGFKRIESILIDSVCRRLSLICFKLDRLESIMCLSFRELHRKDLLDISDQIKKDLNGETCLSERERRSLLQRLSTWIDCHCNSSIEVAQNRTDARSTCVFKQLVDVEQPQNSISFIFSLLSHLMPQSFKSAHQLPNWELFLFTTNLYSLAQQRWMIGESAENLYCRIRKVVVQVQENIALIDNNTIDCLFRQWSHKRFQLGRSLAAAHVEYGGEKKMQLRLEQIQIADREAIFEIMEELELLRLLYQCVCKLVGHEAVYVQTMENFLQSTTFGPDLHLMFNFIGKRDPFDCARQGAVYAMQEILLQGFDVNSHDGWGRLLLRSLMNGKTSAFGLHQLLKCDGIITNEGSRYNEGDTWPVGSRPIQYILNHCDWRTAIIFVANGYNIDITNYRTSSFTGPWGDCGNLYQWAASGTRDAIICVQFLHAMQDPTSKFYRDNLRHAYKHFKEFEAGSERKYDGCLEALLIVCCLLEKMPHNLDITSINLEKPLVEQGLLWRHVSPRSNIIEEHLERKIARSNSTSQFAAQSQFLWGKYGKLIESEKARMQKIAGARSEDQQFFVDLLEPFITNAKSKLLFERLKSSSSDFLTNLNFLNAVLKTLHKEFSVGTNIDIFLQQNLLKE